MNQAAAKLKFTQPLVVREPLKQIVSSVQQDHTVNVTTWCCINQGSSRLRCFFDKNAYVPGETAKIISEMDNSNCKLSINFLRTSLVRTIRLRSNTGQEKVMTDRIVSLNVLGLGPGEVATGEKTRYTDLPLIDMSKNNIQPSTTGTNVKCEYALEVAADMDGCTCCSDIPRIFIPITLYAMAFQPMNIQPPQG